MISAHQWLIISQNIPHHYNMFKPRNKDQNTLHHLLYTHTWIVIFVQTQKSEST